MKKLLLLLLPALILTIAFRSTKLITITGTITDDKGNPLAATVTAGNSSVAADNNGHYQISVSENIIALKFSAVGYTGVTEKINGRVIINISLKPAANNLQEVVVTAYSAKRSKKDYSAAVTTLQGRVNGVQVSAGNGYYLSPSPGMQYQQDEGNTEEYSNIAENAFHETTLEPLSTFSIDVDAASYSNVRRFINDDQLPPAGAVRTEEMINYFKYQYPQPAGKEPFSINTEVSNCPWNAEHRLVLIGLQGKIIPTENLPASNLVFLVDVSGSMMSENKLPLVKTSLKMLADQMREKDKISIVAYAGNAGLVLPATSGAEKIKIKTAIDALEAGGSTAGGAGIQLAYKTAAENLFKGGNNRVILCTDGDFNVGASSDDAMVSMIEKERNKGIFLTVLGFGMGNYKDSKMQQLADKGNGNHAYIDAVNEAKKVLVSEFGGTLFTIAKDVKLQLEFNPAKVAGYRLIGYENRMLNKEDFNDDKKDAGELGSGHTVTALYEIIPAGVSSDFLKSTDPLKYQKDKTDMPASSFSNELLTVKIRYKFPEEDKTNLIINAVADSKTNFAATSDNFRFASAVASFAMLLRNSGYKGNSNFNTVAAIAGKALGNDDEGYRKEFLQLVHKAEVLSNNKAVN